MNQITAILVAVAIAAGFAAGWTAQGWRKDASLLAANTAAQIAADEAREAIKAKEVATALAQRTSAQLAVERAKKAKVVEKVITNDVIKYVQTPGARRCGLDAGGVRILNAAARGVSEDTGAAGAPDGEARDVTAAEVVASVAPNYVTCNQIAADLQALQGWVTGLDNLR